MPISQTDTYGWVYVAKGKYNLYKVGVTTRTPDDRVADFSPKLPFDVKIVWTIECDSAFYIEQKLHRHLSEFRVRGEWFEIPESTFDVLRQQFNNGIYRGEK